MCTEAHAFTGEYLELCAHVERWAQTMLAQIDGPQQVPKMLGPKIKRIGEHAQGTTIFAKPDRVRTLMQKLSPHARLRGKLAHAISHRSTMADEAIVIFESIDASASSLANERFWLLQLSEMPRLVAELKSIRKQLADQQLKVQASVPAIDVPE